MLTMKPKRAKAKKRVTGVAAVKSARKPVSVPAAGEAKSLKAAQREMDQWFEAHAEQVFQAARANTRAMTGRDEL